MKKKFMLMVSALVLVAAMAIGGTLAYLTAQTEAITNTFTVGNITMDLDEKNATDPNGDRVKANTYKIYPGVTVDKDPTVHVNKGSEPCWVYVCIDNQVNGAVAEAAAYNIDTGKWTFVVTEGTKTLYKYNTVVDASAQKQDLTVFTQVTFSGEKLTADNVNMVQGKTITVDAYAHQSVGIGEGTDVDKLAKAHFGFATATP